jgi:hypothetical protein
MLLVKDEAMEALVMTENKSVDLALEVLLSDAQRRKRKREESAAKLGRQRPAGSVASIPLHLSRSPFCAIH